MKKYKEIANKFFNEKVVSAFPSWEVVSANVSTGEVSLNNEVAEVSLFFDEDDNTFSLASIKIKTETKAIDNDSLVGIYKSMVKDVMS